MIKVRKSNLTKTIDRRPPEYKSEILSIVLDEDDEFLYLDQAGYNKLKSKYRPIASTNSVSRTFPGTELKKLISWFPIPKKKNCRSCRNLEAKMNKWGPDKCMEKMDYICKKLSISAKRRGLPFSRMLMERLVKRAIRNATT